jgi:hypothetical protein
MSLTVPGAYRLTDERLRQVCVDEELESWEPVRVLRQRLVQHVRAKMSDGQDEVKMDQTLIADAEVRAIMDPEPQFCYRNSGMQC